MKIAVGTTSEQKIGYLKKVLKALRIRAGIVPVGAKSSVSDQPLTSSETKQGSVNRAKGALKEAPQADFGMGIEVGYHKNKSGYDMFAWVSIVDREGNTVSSRSQALPLPRFHAKTIKAKRYLGDHVMEYVKTSRHPLSKRIGLVITYRESFIVTAIELALLRYLRREEF